jgi:hypothetical protein
MRMPDWSPDSRAGRLQRLDLRVCGCVLTEFHADFA